MKIIVGLGNPGEKYNRTRHNVGFMIVDKIAEDKKINWQINKKFNALIADLGEIILVKPQTFMNNSGKSVAAILRYYKLIPQNIFGIKKDSDLTETLTIIHDDLDLILEKYKLSVNSGSAGHNGVQSIIEHLKTKNFKRLRIGISTKARENIPGDKFVLQKFNQEELGHIKNLWPEIIKIIT